MIGAVAIGRNEGERLATCLRSLASCVSRIVYVDSGSTDGSVELARSMGAEVLELDMSVPFTAARARNEGLARLRELESEVEYVQFIDGDCELVEGFVSEAMATFEQNARYAVVCGRRRERYPGGSIYNAMTDVEWDTPIGEATFCGGDALMRVAALTEIGGYDPAVIAGEEPEMCFRLRERGWIVMRIDWDMTLHDAAMHRFGQWWKRNIRAGHAAAEGAWMHGRSPERFAVRWALRPVFWAGVLPFVAIITAWWSFGLSLVMLAGIYGLQWWRIRAREERRSSLVFATRYATLTLVSQFALLWGELTFVWNKLRRRRAGIIEYKSAAHNGQAAGEMAANDG
ncbi:MAG: glycosyltransferase [Planctomycetota bacterium]